MNIVRSTGCETPDERKAIPADASPADLDALYRRIGWKLMPLLLVAQVLAYLDRVNVGAAKLQMAGDLGLSDTVYGIGAGIFFVGYFLFEVPSNLMLHRVGARVWIARIMVTWGIVSAAAAWVHSPATFYLQRLILGVAEAGFFPGIVLYLTYWFPAHRRGRMTTLFMSATAVAGIVGNMLSGWIMTNLDGFAALSGWQWTFVIEGLPTVVVGLAVHYLLPSRPNDARWLSPEEADAVLQGLDVNAGRAEETQRASRLSASEMVLLTTIYFLLLVGLYGIGFWLPTLVKDTGLTKLSWIGVCSAIPYLIAVLAMNVGARSADRAGNWAAYVVGGAGVASVGFILSASFSGALPVVIAGLSLAAAGTLTALPLFWHLPTMRLTGTAAAAGIATINCFGNLAGFAGPIAFGWLKDRHHDAIGPTMLLALSALAAALLTAIYRRAARH
ncbi:MFS transporter [Burkholderia cepacia]|uniref:MFS transporter n=1 Tax=Burkholderia cepacia TaxID=292 RepID=UPI000F56AEE7|nr:MFS transporter [Burkholderia cepacia]RQT83832.1 MFS transporter [Burkholderia cepacia]RQU03498.1 MFS transporter [Burkholderia cepacia]RQZ80007.1 MFS transporter [Burkholderia cepacia]RRA02200.1 MFS transporter [Burkholderia cepacia]RRA05396.1 MFS transporter [Burkholderia cepacia]